MHVGAAEVFGAHHFTGRRLDQRRAAEKDRALILDDDRLVAHRRHVGAAGGARAHHGGDLRDALRRQVGLVEEDAAEMLLVGERPRPAWAGRRRRNRPDRRRAGGFPGRFLRAQMLFHGQRVVGAAFHRRIVGDDHALDALRRGRCRRSPRPPAHRRHTCRRPRTGRFRGRACRGRAGH
jgi:hypothetical protein